jgi:multidrug efflux system outer membrane protein
MRTSHFILLLAVLGLGACKVPAIVQTDQQVALPNSYQQSADTLNSASIDRNLFFSSQPLETLLDTVLKNNYDLRIALQRIEAARAMLLQARGPLAPQVNAAITPALRRYGLYTMDGSGNASTDIEPGKRVPVDLPDYYLGLQSSWELDIWGKLKNRRKAAAARLLASEEGRNLIQTTLVAQTASAYYELMAADQELKMLDETILLQEQAIQTVRVQKEAAMVNELAVQQFEAQLIGLQGLRLEVQQQAITLEYQLNFLAGRLPRPIPRDTSFFSNPSLPLIHAGIPSQLLRNRPDIRQAELELTATRADVKAARAAFYPAVTITGAFGLQAYKGGLLFRSPESLAYGLVGGLTAPLFNRRIIAAEFAKANAQQQEALLQYSQIVTRSFLEVDEGLKRILNLGQQFQLKGRESEILAASISVSSELFRTGRANYLEVLLARQNALRSRMELINTRKNQYLAIVALYKAVGGG